MRSRHSFDAARFGRHLQRLIIRDGWAISISMGVIFFVAAIWLPLLSWRGIAGLVLVGALTYTSFSFRELERPGTAIPFLMLPVSPTEKLLARWILTCLLFPLGLLLAVSAACIAMGVMQILQSMPFSPVSVAGGSRAAFDVWGSAVADAWRTGPRSIGCYGLLHSIFFWGSITFRKSAFLKTALVTLAGYAAIHFILLAAALATWLLLESAHGASNTTDYGAGVQSAWTVIRVALACVSMLLIPVCLGLTYRRLTSVEV